MKNTLLTLVIILLLLSIGLVFWFRTQEVSDVSRSLVPSAKSVELLQRLQSIRIDTSFFDDASFQSFRAAPTTTIDNIQKGKLNPFINTRSTGAGGVILPPANLKSKSPQGSNITPSAGEITTG